MIPSASSFGCKFHHAPPLCVEDYNGKIYYVVHKLQFMSIVAIHYNVHNHLIMDGKCWKFIVETKKLIIEEADRMLDAKISAISFSDNKTFLVNYLLDDSTNGMIELLKGKQLKHIQDKFYEWSLPNVRNFVVSFKHHSRGGYIVSILEFKSKNHHDYI